MTNAEDNAEKEARHQRGDFGVAIFDDRDTFGIIKAILNLKRRKA